MVQPMGFLGAVFLAIFTLTLSYGEQNPRDEFGLVFSMDHHCGGEDQRACGIFAPGPRCRHGLQRIDGFCRPRGGQGEQPYEGWGFDCQENLNVGADGLCTSCGGAGQPACETMRSGPRCEPGLLMDRGFCHASCGGIGERACASWRDGKPCSDNAIREGDFCTASSAFIETIQIYDKCLQSNGPDASVTLQVCDPENLGQYWFHASRTREVDAAGDPVAMEDDDDRLVPAVYAMSTVADPRLCLTAAGSERSGSAVMMGCDIDSDRQYWRDHRKQGWTPNWGEERHIVNPEYGCLNVRGSSEMSGTDILVWDCSENTSNMIFDEGQTRFGNDANFMVSNAEFSRFYSDMMGADLIGDDHPLENYARCEEQEESTCTFQLRLLFGDKLRAYGRYTGQGHGNDENDPPDMQPLDMRQRYSVDRCSSAHDGHYWDDDENDVGNDTELVACYGRSMPMTRDEQKARNLAILAITVLVTQAKYNGARDEPDCAVSGDPGYLPPVGHPMPRCPKS